MSWQSNMAIREKKKEMIAELEEIITIKASDFYYRKDYETPSLLMIPKGKTLNDSIFHIEVLNGVIQCHLHEPFKRAHFEFLKQTGYLKRKNTSVVKFDSIHTFTKFLEETIIK